MVVGFDDLRRTAERVLQARLSADLRGAPLRILLASEIDGWSDQCGLGMAGAAFPEVFHRELGTTGHAVRPAAFLVSDLAINRMVRSRHPDALDTRRITRRWFVSTAVHEAAHTIQHLHVRRVFEMVTPPGSDYPASERDRYVSDATKRDRDIPHRPWDGHDHSFIRVLCHVVARTDRELNYTADDTFDHHVYGVSRLSRYMQALRCELITGGSLRDKCKARRVSSATIVQRPILEIVRDDPPQEFAKLWASDVSRWEAEKASDS